MRTFPHRNTSGKDVCPICKSNKDGETVLIAIEGIQEGHIAQAIQVHLECLDLQWNKQHNFIYQKIGGFSK